MASFNRFGSSGLGSLYSGMGSLQQPSALSRREDRFDTRRNSRESGFDRRSDRDFGRRDTSPRERRRYSPDPPYSGIGGNRHDNRRSLGSYSMDDLGRDGFNRNRGQSARDRDHIGDGHNMRPPSRGDGILGAKPGDMPRDLTRNQTSGLSSQLAQQQQQLMAMVQTQSLLAAIQAQASVAAKRGGGPGLNPPSLMQGMRIHGNRGRMNDRQNRKRRLSPPRGGQRSLNQSGNRSRRPQQNRNSQGTRSNYQQRRGSERDRSRTNESSRKSEEPEPVEEPYVEETIGEEEEEDEKEEAEVEKETSDESNKASKKTEVSSNEKTSKSEEPKSDNQEEDPEVNLAGQNVNNLVKSLFDSSRGKYVCKVCKIMCTKESCFKQHLYGKRHVKTWLESRGQSFEAEMFKKASEEAAKSVVAKGQVKTSKEKAEQASVKKEGEADKEQEFEVKKEEEVQSKEEEVQVEEQKVQVKKDSSIPTGSEDEDTGAEGKEQIQSKIPAETAEDKKTSLKVAVKKEKFEAKYSCDTRKMAIKEDKYITISSITEAQVRISGFDKGLNTQGCEFVKAVSGFNCRLCKMFILSGEDVMRHVKGRKHLAKYRRYISEHPKYESNQVKRNKELSDILSEREGQQVLLYEVTENEEQKRPHRRNYPSETLDVEVTKYMAVDDPDEDQDEDQDDNQDDNQEEDQEDNQEDNQEDQEDDQEDDQDESHSDILREDADEIQSEPSNKKDVELDESLVEMDREDKYLESSEENLLLLQESQDENLKEETNNEPTAEENGTKELTEANKDPDTSVDSYTESQEDEDEPTEKKARITPTAMARRGRKIARGAALTRGRGRGRGGKRTIRQNIRGTPKQQLPEERTQEQQHDNFMEGFEVVDEVVDDE